jgi:hypothetical protein
MENSQLTKSIISENSSFLDDCVHRLGQTYDKFSFQDSVGAVDTQYFSTKTETL